MAKASNGKKTAGKPGFKFRYCLYAAIIILLLLAIFSHHAHDLAVLEGGSDGMIHNWVGPFGAHISRLSFYLFGLAIYPIIIVLLICAIRSFMPQPKERKGYIGALIAIIFGITLLCAMWPDTFVYRTAILGIGHTHSPHSALSGGVIGQQLAGPRGPGMPAGIIRQYIGMVGTMVVALVFILIGAFFIWWADWKQICIDAIAKTKPSVAKIPKPEKDGKKTAASEEKSKPETEPTMSMAGKPAAPIDELLINTEENIPGDDEEDFDEPDKPEEPDEPEIIRPGSKPSVPGPAAAPKPAAVRGSTVREEKEFKYDLPPLSLLSRQPDAGIGESKESIDRARLTLQDTLESFKVDGQVTGIVTGPRVTRFEISLAPGVNINKVTGISKNIAMNLQAESIRVLAPIPGKNAVGVEVPNSKPSAVFCRAMMESPEWKSSKAEIPVVLGKNVAGKPVILDLAKAPHLLIAGATGSGKSVCMNTLIMSLLYSFTPKELNLIMADPKVVELAVYASLPHLITPVVNDPKKLPLALRWAVNEMEKRYRILAKAKTKNLAGFNSRPLPDEPQFDDEGNVIPDHMPILVIIVDELADVMMTESKGDVETSVARIAQKGRAAGIHIVIATQRPSTNIITGVIKANLPTRIAFKVGSGVDSRVILDQNGAESLLGRGDMLFVPPGSSNIERIQGAMVEDPDIQKVVDFVVDQAKPQFDEQVVSDEESGEGEDAEMEDGDLGIPVEINPIIKKYLEPGDDELISKALEIVVVDRKVSTSYLQRRLKIGYNRAAEIVDLFEERGIVSEPLAGGQKRDILIFDEIDNPEK